MLTLPIKKQWFDMIVSGEKQEEYRSLTPYYFKRFEKVGLIHGFLPSGKAINIVLRNGYGKNRPQIIVLVTLRIDNGKAEWGAEPNKKYFVLDILMRSVVFTGSIGVGEQE